MGERHEERAVVDAAEVLGSEARLDDGLPAVRLRLRRDEAVEEGDAQRVVGGRQVRLAEARVPRVCFEAEGEVGAAVGLQRRLAVLVGEMPAEGASAGLGEDDELRRGEDAVVGGDGRF